MPTPPYSLLVFYYVVDNKAVPYDEVEGKVEYFFSIFYKKILLSSAGAFAFLIMFFGVKLSALLQNFPGPHKRVNHQSTHPLFTQNPS